MILTRHPKPVYLLAEGFDDLNFGLKLIANADPTTRSKKRNNDTGSTSLVYIYMQANFVHPPTAQLPGHKKASVSDRFSPIVYELQQGVLRFEDPQLILMEQGKEDSVHLDLGENSTIPSLYPASPHRHSISAPNLSLSLTVALSPIFLGGPSALLTLHWRYVLPMLGGQHREHQPPPPSERT